MGPWIKALCLVAVAGLAAALLEHSHARAIEAVYVLKSMVFAAVGLLSAHPLLLGISNAGVALLLLTVRDEPEKARLFRRVSSLLVTQLNRSASHLEALFTWLTLAVWWAPSLWLQVVGIFAAALLGPLGIDALTYGGKGWWRLLVPAGVTLLGVGLVVGVDLAQWREVAPLVGLVLAGLVPRTCWSLWKERSLHGSVGTDSSWAQFVDRLVMAGALGALVVVPLRALKPGHKASVENRVHRTLRWRSCAPQATPELSLFIVADSQFHALDGKRSGFHLDMVDTEVPVSVRPVEVDLLSAVTLKSFADVFLELRKTRPDLMWAHLGDSADIGCTSELDRFIALAPRFGLGELAAVIPGNHDVAFLGNLTWHPDWDAACPKGRSSGDYAREHLASLMPNRPGRVVSTGSPFLASVVRLGKVGSEDVVGVFLDTTDVPWDRVGIAGAQGGIPDAQATWVAKTLDALPKGRVILFGHHPIDQWTGRSRAKLEGLARALGPRLWALVSAHTHLASLRTHRLDGRTVPEFIVGSTIDPPQEAALLEGEMKGGEPVLTLRTLPAVRRLGETCAGDPALTLSGERCAAVFDKLRSSAACAPLFSPAAADGGVPLSVSPQCQKTAEVWMPLLEPGRGHVETPEELDCLQEVRAEQLLTCLGTPSPNHAPLHDPGLSERVLAASERDPASWVCLSWAASVLQSHKAQRWNFAQAMAFCLDPSSTYGELQAQWP